METTYSKTILCEYIQRYRELELREEKIRILWERYSEINPFLSVFMIRKFNRVLKKIHEMKKNENQKWVDNL